MEPLEAARVKSVAEPVRLMECGLPAAASVMVSEPVRFPDAVGAKVTLMVQEAAGAAEAPQALV